MTILNLLFAASMLATAVVYVRDVLECWRDSKVLKLKVTR